MGQRESETCTLENFRSHQSRDKPQFNIPILPLGKPRWDSLKKKKNDRQNRVWGTNTNSIPNISHKSHERKHETAVALGTWWGHTHKAAPPGKTPNNHPYDAMIITCPALREVSLPGCPDFPGLSVWLKGYCHKLIENHTQHL